MQEPQAKSDYKYVDIERVNRYLESGALRGQPKGDMLVCSYNEIILCKDKIEWDETLRTCRGIRIKRDDGLIISPAMKKCFNLQEKEEVGAIAKDITRKYNEMVQDVERWVGGKFSPDRCSHKEAALALEGHPLFHHVMGARRGHTNWKEKLWKVV